MNLPISAEAPVGSQTVPAIRAPASTPADGGGSRARPQLTEAPLRWRPGRKRNGRARPRLWLSDIASLPPPHRKPLPAPCCGTGCLSHCPYPRHGGTECLPHCPYPGHSGTGCPPPPSPWGTAVPGVHLPRRPRAWWTPRHSPGNGQSTRDGGPQVLQQYLIHPARHRAVLTPTQKPGTRSWIRWTKRPSSPRDADCRAAGTVPGHLWIGPHLLHPPRGGQGPCDRAAPKVPQHLPAPSSMRDCVQRLREITTKELSRPRGQASAPSPKVTEHRAGQFGPRAAGSGQDEVLANLRPPAVLQGQHQTTHCQQHDTLRLP